MKRRIKQVIIGFAVFIGVTMVLLVGAFLYINSTHGQNYIQTTINHHIPGSMEWEHGHVSLVKGEVEIKNAVIKEPGDGSIAGFNRFFIKLSWSSLLRGSLTLEAVFLEKPWTKIHIDEAGEVNLIRTFVSKPSEVTKEEKVAGKAPPSMPVGIAVEKLDLSQGSLHFEEARRKTTIVIPEINLVAKADLTEQSGKLILNIRQGKIKGPDTLTDVDECTIEATLENGRIDPLIARIRSPLARLELSAMVADIFDKPSMNAVLDCTAALHEIRHSLNLKPTLAGQVVAKLRIEGDLENPDATLHLDYGGGTILENAIDRANLDLQLKDRLVTIDALSINAADGTLHGHGSIDFRQAFQEGLLSPKGDLQTIMYDISLDEKGVRLDKLRHGTQGWKGIVNSSLSLRGTGISLQNAAATASLTIDGKQISTQQLVTPVDLNMNSTMELNKRTASVRELTLRADGSELKAYGSFDIPSRKFNGNLSVVSPDLAGTLSPFGLDAIEGQIGLKAILSGSTERPLFAMDLQGDGLRFQDITFGTMSLKADLDDSGILGISRCVVENGSSNIEMTGTVKMYDQSTILPLYNQKFTLDIEGNAIRLEDFVKTMAGNVSLAGSISGTLADPEGTVTVTGNDFNLYGQKLAKVDLKADILDTRIRFEPLQLFVTPTEFIESRGWISFEKGYELNLVSQGISLHNIETIRAQDIADGLLRVDIRGNGTIDNPTLTGNLSISNVKIREKQFDDFNITLDLRDQVARLKGTLNFDLDGVFDLKKKDFSLAALFADTDLSPYLKIAGNPDLSGKLTGKIEASGNLESVETAQANMNVTALNLLYRDTEILHTDELKLSLKNKEISIPETVLMLPPKGQIAISGKSTFDGPLSFRAEGTIPLDIVGRFVKDLDDINGTLTLTSKVEGTLPHPAIHADIDLAKVGGTVPVLQGKLHDLGGTIRIKERAITFEEISGGLDTGSFKLAGEITLREDFQPKRISVNVDATTLPVQIPDTFDLLLSSRLQLEGTEEKSIIKGELIILEGTYYKDVNLSLLQGIAPKKSRAAPPREEITHPFLKNMSLDISIKRRNPLLIDNNLATMDVNPDLRIVGTVNNPTVRGRASVESGTVRYQGKTFVVKQGIIDFLNPYEIDPTFDIKSEVSVRDWLIFLEVSGTQHELAFNLTSDPPEEHGDILSLLLLGKTTGELISREGGTTKSTEQMLAGLIASTYGEEIKEKTGLDIFEMETSDERGEAPSDRVKVTMGKELSTRMTVKYSAESKEGEVIQSAIAEYKLLEHFLARGFQDTRGIYGGELQFRLEFR